MNKTFAEFLAELISEKENKTALTGIDSDSKASIWRQLFEVFAWVLYNFALSALLHLQEIRELIANQKVFNLRKYRSEALRFQYGFDLVDDSDIFKTTYINNGVEVEATTEQINESMIVKYAACSRVIDNGRAKIVLKIAPEDLNDVFPNDVMISFSRYIEEISPAGDHVTVLNYSPDMLKYAFIIKVDPLVLNASGMSILTATYPVQIAIENFLKNLPFNGELSVQKLEAAILAVDGVEDLTTVSIESKWIDPALGGYGLYQPVSMSVIPASGRFKSEDYNGLTYIS